MNQTTKSPKADKLQLIWDVAVSILAVLVGIAYIAAAYHLYSTGGKDPYTRERVGSYLLMLLFPSALLIASIISSFVLSVIKNRKEGFDAYNDPSYQLMRTEKRIPSYKLDATAVEAIKKERSKRLIYQIITAVIATAAFALALIFALDTSRYQNEELTTEIVSAVSYVLPLSLLAIIAISVCSYLSSVSAMRELAIRREATRSENASEEKNESGIFAVIRSFLSKNSKIITLVCRIIFALLAALLILFGVLGGGMADVLAKAVKICTECIGLG